MDKQIAIAIDGPAAAGKSTVAKRVAEILSYIYIDTGAMYRALTFAALKANVDVTAEGELLALLNEMQIDLVQSETEQKVLVNGEDVTRDIRSQVVTNHVSHISTHALIRTEMVKRQRELAANCGVVMDGRDIGTHVLPGAELKYFLIASVAERAKRRYEENLRQGIPTDLAALTKEIEQRDKRDTERDVAPLIKADDAIELDTTSLTIDDVVNEILQRAKRLIAN